MSFKSTILAVILFLGPVAVANAQASRTWVSGVGDDANPCSRTAPCKTFAGAISKTAAGGEIDALDPAGYGGVTITKSITIDGGGNLASVLVSGTNGIVINAGASAIVTIRNVAINGLHTGLNGIRILSAGVVHIERSEIFGFTGAGIDAEPGAASVLFVLDTVTRDNGVGVLLRPGPYVAATLDKVRATNNYFGVRAENNASVTIRDSVATGNVMGFYAIGAGAAITLDNSVAAYNWGNGVTTSGGGSAVTMSNSTIMNNAQGIDTSAGGNVYSFGNNKIVANGTNGAPTGNVSLQ